MTTKTAYSVGEVAGMLSVHPDTVLRWCKRGALASARTPGGHRRIAAAAVDAYIAQLTAGGSDRECADAAHVAIGGSDADDDERPAPARRAA